MQKIKSAKKTMSNKTPSITSAVLTIVLLIIFAILSVLTQMLALNGASEQKGFAAMGGSLVCEGIVGILAAVFASWLTNLVIVKFNWNKILAVTVAVIASGVLGAVASSLCVIVAISLAGI